jgi:signal transduction histidine kinase
MLADALFAPQTINLNEAIREMFRSLSSRALARGTTLSTELTPQLPPVLGDRIQIEQVILNLATNAMDAMDELEGGERKVVARSRLVDEFFAEVTVEDTGPGIPDKRLEKVFEPFFTTRESGMGMGLALVRSIVESHGGQIWADSSTAGGAMFRFTLPLLRTEAVVADSNPAGTPARPPGGPDR